MNDRPASFAALSERPALPIPTRQRWQPLRLGLVELFHYDSEEFWFRDGHLLLRGNNGTGKSKVLSLTLPFLFDAQLKSSRIEPDGDAGKKMSWNLLLGWATLGLNSGGWERMNSLNTSRWVADCRPWQHALRWTVGSSCSEADESASTSG